MSTAVEIDFKVFENAKQKQRCTINDAMYVDYNDGILDSLLDDQVELISKPTTEEHCITKCDYLNRISVALIYYSSTYASNDSDTTKSDKLMEFCKKTYPSLLDDYIHLVSKHSNQLEEIIDAFQKHHNHAKCKVEQCKLTIRHYRNRDTNDDSINFYHDTFDSLHYYIFHLYDIGLRISQTELQQDIKNDNDNIELSCHDNIFMHTRELIKLKRKQSGVSVDRFKNESNKYNITIGLETESREQKQDTEDTEETFMDKMYECIQTDNDISSKHLNQLNHFLTNEEYDTDAIQDDYTFPFSNIAYNITHIPSVDAVARFLKSWKVSSVTWSTGFVFWYWPYYKQLMNDSEELRRYTENMQKTSWLVNDFSGYSVEQLYVTPNKYTNLQDEILNCGFVTINDWNELVVLKCDEYFVTQRVKAMIAEGASTMEWSDDDRLHFGISRYTKISKEHLYSLILYCDFSELCTDFSKTFRAIKQFETLSCIKKRNRQYWWMSKLLREAVQYFGSSDEKGPFYCGMGLVMNMPAFAIRLNSPTSISKDITMAHNYAQPNGMMLEFNNSDIWAKELKCFNVSFMSRYKEESERLFIHGQWSIEISNIRLISNCKNFSLFLKPLSQFDSAISGGNKSAVKGFAGRFDDREDVKIIQLLFEQDESIPKYMLDTFQMFRYHKKTLNINLDYLTNNYPSVLQDLIVGWSYKEGCDGNKISSKFKDMHEGKLLKSKLINLFPNLTDIVIECTDSAGWHSYRVS
eukprot:377148_1